MRTQTLTFTAERDAYLHFSVREAGEAEICSARPLALLWTDADGVPVPAAGQKCAFPQAGNYRVRLCGDRGEKTTLSVLCSENVLPFLMTGIGVLW